MLTFKGTYNYSIDHKGRLSIPVKFRESAETKGQHFVVSQGFDGCLYLFPYETWAIIEEKVAQLKWISNPRVRFFKGEMFPNAQDVFTDHQGRIPIPQILLELAKITKDVVIRGALDIIEIWDPQVLKEYRARQTESFEDVAGQLLI